MSLTQSIYPRVPIGDYVRDCFHLGPPSLSASIAHVLLTASPSHAWYAHPRLNPEWAPESTEATDVGSIAHALLLEGDRSKVVVVEAPDWRTKAAREAREAARYDGKLPILADKMATVEEMVAVAMGALGKSELGAEVFLREHAETTLLWQEDGVWCRSRPDHHTEDWRIILDYKTVGGSAEPAAWGRTQLLGMGYDLQIALALRAVKALGILESTFVFMCQETDPPYAVSFVSLAPAFLAVAEQRLTYARNMWRHCLETGAWPSYPSRVAYIEPPGWAAAQTIDAVSPPVDDGRPLADQLFGEEAP